EESGVVKHVDVAEVVVLVFDLARPVLGEQVFKTSTNGVAVTSAFATEAVGEASVSPGITALGVQQRRTPGVAEAAGDRAQVTVGEPAVGILEAVVGFQTRNPVRGELRVITDLHTAHERAVAATAEEVVAVAAEGATDVTTDI